MVYGVDKAFHAGDWIPDRDIASRKNRTKLQSVLRWSIVSVQPSEISLAKACASDPNATALSISINIRQTWSSSTDPPRPLTICTAHTILAGSESPSIRLYMTSVDDKSRHLLGDPLAGINMNHREPLTDDWKTVLPFFTIPPSDGITVTRDISYRDLLARWGKPVPPEADSYPKPGEEFELRFASDVACRKETFTDWWNWGDLEGDLRHVKLIDMPNPKVNTAGPTEPPEGSLLPFASWDDEADDEGNWMVRLQVHMDTTPVLVRFVE
ncbi:hypothetical protein QBC37DRAFT_435092 [Rhypophila decipiens]|uniref:Uncharacterized protein n=1 Tax=Rhypophila decipiens TaxID=261697 RepID=A0AAN7B0G0_9PEZI|nr:hypothetical protein QBC37DRAFT_435092 [Rhypophila decipiens]